MTRGSKIMLGILTFLPAVLILFYALGVGMLLKNMILQYPEDNILPLAGELIWVITSALFLGLLSFGLLVYYLVHAINNMEIEKQERLVWILSFVLISVAAFPVYWYIRIWKRSEVLTMSAT